MLLLLVVFLLLPPLLLLHTFVARWLKPLQVDGTGIGECQTSHCLHLPATRGPAGSKATTKAHSHTIMVIACATVTVADAQAVARTASNTTQWLRIHPGSCTTPVTSTGTAGSLRIRAVTALAIARSCPCECTKVRPCKEVGRRGCQLSLRQAAHEGGAEAEGPNHRQSCILVRIGARTRARSSVTRH